MGELRKALNTEIQTEDEADRPPHSQFLKVHQRVIGKRPQNCTSDKGASIKDVP